MSAYRRQASASIVPPTRSVRLQIARELCYAHRHRRHGRRSQSDQIGRNARYSLDPTDANATLGHGILLEFFPPRQTLPPLRTIAHATRQANYSATVRWIGTRWMPVLEMLHENDAQRSVDSALRAFSPLFLLVRDQIPKRN